MSAFDDLHKQAKEAEKKWKEIDSKVEYLKSVMGDKTPVHTNDLLKQMCETVILLSEVQRPTNVGSAIGDLEESLKGLQGIMGNFGKLK